MARTPKRVRTTGWRGGRRSGPRAVSASSSQRRTNGPTSRRHARPSAPQGGGRVAQPPFQDHRPTVRQGMGGRRRRVDPLQAVLGEGHGPEHRRSGSEGMDGGAHVVDEPGQGELGGPSTAADRLGRLEHLHRQAGAGQRHRRRQPVRPRPHDDRVSHRTTVRRHPRPTAKSRALGAAPAYDDPVMKAAPQMDPPSYASPAPSQRRRAGVGRARSRLREAGGSFGQGRRHRHR